MKYTIRKGLESPCMIGGFLSSDYWIFVGSCGGVIILFFLSIRSGIMTGSWSQTLLIFLAGLVGLPILRHRLKKKAQSTKFRESKNSITVSNLKINRKLLKKRQDERR